MGYWYQPQSSNFDVGLGVYIIFWKWLLLFSKKLRTKSAERYQIANFSVLKKTRTAGTQALKARAGYLAQMSLLINSVGVDESLRHEGMFSGVHCPLFPYWSLNMCKGLHHKSLWIRVSIDM